MISGGIVGWCGAGLAGVTAVTMYAFSPVIAKVICTTVTFSLPTVIYARMND
jgi:hypothetical protein